MRVGWSLLWHRFTSGIGDWLRVLQLVSMSFRIDALDLLRVVEVVEESVVVILVTIFDYEVTGKFMLLLRLMDNVCSL